jgi:hypothetical protein
VKPRPVRSRYYRIGAQESYRYATAALAWQDAPEWKKTLGAWPKVYRVDAIETWTPVRRPRIQRKR